MSKAIDEKLVAYYGMLCTVGEYLGVGFSGKLEKDDGESGETEGIAHLCLSYICSASLSGLCRQCRPSLALWQGSGLRTG